MHPFVFQAKSLDDTDRFATVLARVLPKRAVVALDGALGAGKTQLVRSLAKACGVPAEDVVSPTFVLCQEYHGRRTLYHLDAYRLRDDDEFLELGVEEYFDAPAITLIEWAERVAHCLPNERLEIFIEPTGEHSRKITVTAYGPRLEQTVQELSQQLVSV